MEALLVLPETSQIEKTPPRPAPTRAYSWDEFSPNARVVYTRDPVIANKELSKLKKGPLGFDMEWKPTFVRGEQENRVALVQLANDEVVLLIQTSAMRGLPQKLVEVLEDPEIVKAGVGIQGDVQKLFRDWGAPTIRNVVDLSLLARSVDNARWKGKYNHPIGLARLVEVYQYRLLEKGKVTRSNWERVLTPDQQIYASNDAHSGYSLYNHLMGLRNPESLLERNWYTFDCIWGALRGLSGNQWNPQNPNYDPGPPPPPKVPKTRPPPDGEVNSTEVNVTASGSVPSEPQVRAASPTRPHGAVDPLERKSLQQLKAIVESVARRRSISKAQPADRDVSPEIPKSFHQLSQTAQSTSSHTDGWGYIPELYRQAPTQPNNRPPYSGQRGPPNQNNNRGGPSNHRYRGDNSSRGHNDRNSLSPRAPRHSGSAERSYGGVQNFNDHSNEIPYRAQPRSPLRGSGNRYSGSNQRERNLNNGPSYEPPNQSHSPPRRSPPHHGRGGRPPRGQGQQQHNFQADHGRQAWPDNASSLDVQIVGETNNSRNQGIPSQPTQAPSPTSASRRHRGDPQRRPKKQSTFNATNAQQSACPSATAVPPTLIPLQ